MKTNDELEGTRVSGEDKIRTLIFTYQATDEDAEVFTIVMGSVAENFRGAKLHEVVDETVLGDGDDRGAVDALYQTLTREGRLTDEQRTLLDDFGQQLREWRGDDDG